LYIDAKKHLWQQCVVEILHTHYAPSGWIQSWGSFR